LYYNYCLSIGATNRPDELDEAARRRFVKRIYIPLPDFSARKQLLDRLLRDSKHRITDIEIHDIATSTENYSGADIQNLCTEAAMGPMREIAMKYGNLTQINAEDVPYISFDHFKEALDSTAPSVSQSDLQKYIEWNTQFGSFRRLV
jgi:SpoVK/Ycf46/Vps4 family AAA+-type ATPase